MKGIARRISILFLLLGLPALLFACEIVVQTEGLKKAKYHQGEVIIIHIEVRLVHRNCPVDIEKTDISMNGLQIIGATKWVNTSGNTWERRIRVKVMKDASGKAFIQADRNCRKDGGHATLVLQL
jgi:hypothetical protein